ncbi:MAG: hypothetical protein COV32_02490 [Candidatus Yonathbacteria bacterium CG10_big_fil_rev_8_21_14_0_10_43_136]|uniref:Uncharacterized protein n=2 Tax=Parcubacteria group TaxID=1794811 RepID=A0A2M7Q5F1_9BACT|nr:MAG: hypothetical protein AUK15_00260 [Candidatus Nomurabacteria bacterium CG2_30_43_9]PIQ36159.1 MAG: hypothetical protein COW60_00005 [Candidatus Yonathbacteria bacterium CG17_big_fil_post_rev_8_21_14_2_50_43_9]PIR40613.1 MAG: hypothetical protein COV32_02490 [Candidatus Yonathbacteria bacterium CG10_big_fil_rev_8_21_14_0_10_43_136]PIY58290.1 MAG: hypothetical protein COY98_02625 [Candidatus Yonathbacteria bacterium CG_4_10_14_0_8_um_filter_43_17]PJC22618.1 MAG: hypothetical protein CO060_
MNTKTLGLGAVALAFGIAGLSVGTAFAYQVDPQAKGPNYSTERHEAMEKAFENKDFDAWIKALPAQAQSKIGQKVTKENFANFSKIHELMEDGKVDDAQALRQELGLGIHDGSGKCMGKQGMHKGMNRGMNR